MSAKANHLADALTATELALAAAREGHNELVKVQSVELNKDNSAAALKKIINILETIHNRLAIIEANERPRALPQHRSIQ